MIKTWPNFAVVPLLLCTCAMFFDSPTRTEAASTSTKAFFKAAPDRSQGLPADELYPRGRLLMCSVYSVGSPELERLKGDGFTAIGPYYGDQSRSEVIEKARANGLKCIYSVGKRIDFVNNPKYVMPSDKDIRDTITQDIKSVADNPEIAVWNLANEELRHWRRDEMHWMEVAVDAIRKADRRRRPVMMYDPNHRTAAGLAHTVRYLDFSSKGMYANLLGFKDQRIWIRWSVEQEIKAIAQANPSAIPVSVLWMAKDPDTPEEDELIDDWTRHDVYLSMVSGAKGIIIFSGWNRRKGFERTFSKYYEGYASAVRALNGDLNLSQIFLFGEKRNDLAITVTSGPPTLRLEYQKQTTVYPSVSHLDVAYGTDRYLFMVNSANSPVQVTVGGLPRGRVLMRKVLESGGFYEVKGGKFEVMLPKFGVMCCHFKH